MQPGAKPGDQTYCPISGVVFTITDATPRVEVEGNTLYTCCDGCARYFAEHREDVVKRRKLGS